MNRFVMTAGRLAGFSLLIVSVASASQTSGTTSFSFLNLPVGARATGMGQAFTSVPNDVQALPYNPASLASLLASQMSFQHLSYVEDTVQEAVMYGKAGRDEGMSWGLSVNYLRVDNITRTVATDLPTGEGYRETGALSTYDMAMGLSAAGPVSDDIKVGATVKLLRESLADASSNAGAIDVGVLYRLMDEHSWNVGGSLSNFGFASKFADAAVKLPYTFRGGISGQPFSQWLLAADYVKRIDTEGELDIGAEVTPKKFFSIRLGYRYALTRNDYGGFADFSAGIGLRHKTISLDYAFIPLGDLGTTHRISIGWRFKPRVE